MVKLRLFEEIVIEINSKTTKPLNDCNFIVILSLKIKHFTLFAEKRDIANCIPRRKFRKNGWCTKKKLLMENRIKTNV